MMHQWPRSARRRDTGTTCRPPVLLALLALLALSGAARAASSCAASRPDSLRRQDIAPVFRPLVSPTLTVALTPVFPGWGQLATGGGWRAVLAFGAEGFYWSHLLMNDRKADRLRGYTDALTPGPQRDFYDAQVHEYRERVRDFAWWSAGALLIIALDAYVGAHLQQFDRDPVPVPEHWQQPGTGAPAPASATLDGAVLWSWRASF